jgi:superfamily I DNA and/or RNA helicase
LIEEGLQASQVAILAPYVRQIKLLRELLPEQSYPGLIVSTIDGFEGRECDYAIVTCVRNETGIGLLGNVQRMNVALTRARLGLIVIGNCDTLEEASEHWDDFCAHCAKSGALCHFGPSNRNHEAHLLWTALLKPLGRDAMEMAKTLNGGGSGSSGW